MALNIHATGRPLLFGLVRGAALAITIAVAVVCGSGDDEDASDTATGVEGQLTLGDSTELVTDAIDEDGGTVTIDRSGDPLDGMELTVPAGSYDDEVEFAVSSRPITGHSYDDRINPISPLIGVENGGDYADEIIAVKVPVEVPDGHFAMGFFYDEETGALEGMPLLAEDGSSVTLGTRHFSDFFISSIAESVLSNITVDSGFRPGADDWQFENQGSYIAPGGHCAGQSIAAMWYYYERGRGGDPLYGRYDNNGESPNTPDLWEDDNLGYRLSSALQAGPWEDQARAAFRAASRIDDRLTFLALSYAMDVTRGPQFLEVWGSVPLPGERQPPGHAVIAYAIDGGMVRVADPNKPGNLDRTIPYADDKLGPYDSALVAGGRGIKFDNIEFVALTAVVDWGVITQGWADLDDGAVGDDYFPAYTIYGIPAGEPMRRLVDGVVFAGDQLGVSPPDVDWTVTVFRDGEELPKERGFFKLLPGENKLGILVERDDEYVDFYRATVIYNEVVIDPIAGNPGDDIEITATMPARIPDGRFEWNFGDGTPIEDLSLGAMHVFAEKGEYPVRLNVYDADDRLVGRGEAVARIGDAATSPASTTSTQAGVGAWVQTSVEPSQTVNEPSGCYNSQTVTVSGQSATTYGKCTWTGPDVDVYQQTQHSWSAAPPQRLASGETLQITVSATLEGTFLSANLGGGAVTGVRVDLIPGGGPQPGSVAVQAKEGESLSDTSAYSVPAGSEGDVMVIAFEFNGIGGKGATKYIYEWQDP